MKLRHTMLVALMLPLMLAGCTNSTGSGISPVGEWGSTADPDEPSLVFAGDGTLTGTDGCNRLMGDWAVDDTTVTFSPIASTLMYCDGVDTWLTAAATAEVSDRTLIVHDASGTKIGTLERSAGS